MSRFNACFENKNMDGQRLKSLNYLIALEVFSDCKNKRLNGSILKYTTWEVIVSLFLSYFWKEYFPEEF